MRTIVCVKQILDPEIPPRDFAIDAAAKEAVRGRTPLVIGPFDLNALEVAVQLKEQAGGTVTAVTIGGAESREALKRALAMGCDDAVLIADPALARPDPRQTALLLGAAVRALGGADLVLCGRQSGDWDFGQVGARLGEELGYAVVPLLTHVRGGNGYLQLRQESSDGTVLLETAPPVAGIVTNAEVNRARLPKVKDTMMAGRKPLKEWTLRDLGLTADAAAADRELEVLELMVPPAAAGCELVEGSTGAEKGTVLAKRLLETGVI
ncbi:MAG TPA: electron transfer flavoprotein subunit beta/FixA family protein [bacterium]